MRQWRVGSFSMGILLIFLGVVLVLVQMNQWDYVMTSLIWVPTVLIVLGIEIVAYLILSKQEHPVVKYDIFSIFFICCLGVVSIGIYVVSTTGILNVVETAVSAEEVQGTLPEITEKLDQTIEKVVIEPGNTSVTLEANNSDDLSIFGVYTSTKQPKVEITREDVVSIHRVDNTLYVQFLDAPNRVGMGYGYAEYNPTISVPGKVEVEVRSWINKANVSLTSLKANWYIESTEYSFISDVSSANVKLTANSYELNGEPNDEEGKDILEKKYGKGENNLTFGHIDSLVIND
ncbi:hypothetical protein [Aquibacillus kalidii]|uniref:hypothetical protein n=1 Tax=Aquibacillus kalidii TaxID=2762597 RepID=UPI001643FDA6|nr:hypothetical protein [Aquibacillus kalidii]